MPVLTTSVAALAAVAVAAAPGTASIAAAPAPPTVTTQECEQVTSGELSPEQVDELLQAVRSLVTRLTTILDDDRALGLAQQLRSRGVTPAVSSGWRQQAHDLADRLMWASDNDPDALRMAVLLARVGYSPTPADLTRAASDGATSDQTPQSDGIALPPRAPAAVGLAAAGARAGARGGAHPGALGLAIAELNRLGPASSPVPDESTGDSDKSEDSNERVQDDDQDVQDGPDSQMNEGGEGSRECADTPSGRAGEADEDLVESPGQRPDSRAGEESATEDSWEQDAASLLSELARTDDPDARELEEALTSLGVTPGPDASPDIRSSEPARDADAETQHKEDADGSASEQDSDRGTDSDTDLDSSSDAAGNEVGTGSGRAWEADAQELATMLEQAGDDPTARELADLLAEVGIDPAPEGSEADQPAESDAGADRTGREDGDQVADSGAPDEQDADDSGADERSGSHDSGADEASAGLGDGDPAVWDRLAECESSGDWAIETGNGYYGGLQFDKATWQAYGGAEHAPTAEGASREQQISVAEKLRADRGGYGAWPACAQKLGLPR